MDYITIETLNYSLNFINTTIADNAKYANSANTSNTMNTANTYDAFNI